VLTLRPYQLSMIESIREQLKAGRSRILAVAPTGAGKTCLMAHMISGAVAKGRRVWFLNHRRELVRQSVETLQDSANVDCGIIASGFGSNGYHLAQIASIQTLMRRWEKYVLPDIIIIDEAHHSCAASWSKLLNDIVSRKPNVKVIGLTATPQRLDGRGLAQWFDVIVEGPNTAQLIQDGYLAKYRMWGASLPDLTGVHTTAGDYNKGELEAALSRTAVVGDALTEYRKHCDGKRALVFMWSIRSSQDLAQRFNDTGIPAMHVDGETDSAVRDRAIADFRNGRIKVLSNVELFSEGLDIPAVEAGFLMRPTQSLAMYLQQVGRILRPFEGKEAALIFDHAGHAANHGYPDDVRTWTLDGIEKKAAKRKGVLIRQCMKCYATVPLAAKDCKWCGYIFPVKPREVETVDGELQELDMAAMERLFGAKQRRIEQGRADSLAALEVIERQRGYRRGWALKVWEAKSKKKAARHYNDKLAALADSYRPKS
jgi:DNA repair protein RadD